MAVLLEMRFSGEGRGFMAAAAVVAAVPKRFANDCERFPPCARRMSGKERGGRAGEGRRGGGGGGGGEDLGVVDVWLACWCGGASDGKKEDGKTETKICSEKGKRGFLSVELTPPDMFLLS